MIKLLNCPFCNGEPEFVRRGTSNESCIVQCTECGIVHESSNEGDRSGSSWNDRVDVGQQKLDELQSLINSPEIDDFMKGVPLEAAHQIERWGKNHDLSKSEQDWIFLFGWLAGKATQAEKSGDYSKAKHHAITAAAALLNWHRSVCERDPNA